jgi:hypothetical protein
MSDHPAAKDRPVFALKFRAEPGIDAIKALRTLLKVSLRRFGLRAVDAVEVQDIPKGTEND